MIMRTLPGWLIEFMEFVAIMFMFITYIVKFIIYGKDPLNR